MKQLDWDKIDRIIAGALAEDLGSGDITCESVLPPSRPATARIISKDRGRLAGAVIAARVFRNHDPGLSVQLCREEGSLLQPGDELLVISGEGRKILEAERTALNLLGRCCGIATRTAAYVEAVSGTGSKILDTRKTVPLLRELDKYAVRAGGGHNHRYGLFDMVLIKENHIRWAGGLAAALQNVRRYQQQTAHRFEVEVEVENLAQLDVVLGFSVNRVMLDNFALPDIRRAVARVAGRMKIEVSGGVQLEYVGEIAATGVDFISVGALTHSVKNFDASLLFDELPRAPRAA